MVLMQNASHEADSRLSQHRKLLELADSVAGSEELELDSMRGRVRELQQELREGEG